MPSTGAHETILAGVVKPFLGGLPDLGSNLVVPDGIGVGFGMDQRQLQVGYEA